MEKRGTLQCRYLLQDGKILNFFISVLLQKQLMSSYECESLIYIEKVYWAHRKNIIRKFLKIDSNEVFLQVNFLLILMIISQLCCLFSWNLFRYISQIFYKLFGFFFGRSLMEGKINFHNLWLACDSPSHLHKKLFLYIYDVSTSGKLFFFQTKRFLNLCHCSYYTMSYR